MNSMYTAQIVERVPSRDNGDHRVILANSAETRRGRPPAFDESIRKATATIFPEARGRTFHRRCALGRAVNVLHGTTAYPILKDRQTVLESLGLIEHDADILATADWIVKHGLSTREALGAIRTVRGIDGRKPGSRDALEKIIITTIDKYRETHDLDLDDVADALRAVLNTAERMTR